jgi:hypothetical protein
MVWAGLFYRNGVGIYIGKAITLTVALLGNLGGVISVWLWIDYFLLINMQNKDSIVIHKPKTNN